MATPRGKKKSKQAGAGTSPGRDLRLAGPGCNLRAEQRQEQPAPASPHPPRGWERRVRTGSAGEEDQGPGREGREHPFAKSCMEKTRESKPSKLRRSQVI